MRHLFPLPIALLVAACSSTKAPSPAPNVNLHPIFEIFASAHYDQAQYASAAKGVFGYPFAADPKPRFIALPVYPPEPWKKQIEGVAEVSFTMNSDGRVIDVRVTKSSPEVSFGESAVSAIKKSRFFLPATTAQTDMFESSYRYTFTLARS